MEQLYETMRKGIRYFLFRNLGQDELDDRVHDCFVIVTTAIKNGELREPERLMGYVRTIVKRQISGAIQTNTARRNSHADFEKALFTISDGREGAENFLQANQRGEVARQALKSISKRDREILQRFYVAEQSMDQICREMGLNYNQFRLLKSRAKARFGELGKKLYTRPVKI